MGAAGDWGTIVAGNRADLILLPENPLEDVTHTQERLGVMVRGQWFTQAELDGLVEAFRVADAAGFALAVQWHPEWRVTENPLSMKLFGAFGDACRARAARRARA